MQNMLEQVKNKYSKIKINYYSDRIITLILILIVSFCYLKFSLKDKISFIYLCSLIWYIVILFYMIKVRIFSGTGLYIIYMLFFVQSGILMQKLYFTFDIGVIFIITIYNIVAPGLVFVFSKFRNVRTVNLKVIKISSTWVTLLFLCGFISILLYFVSVGSIPIFAEDAENFRVQALAGKAFLVVIASNCFMVSIVMTEKASIRYLRMVTAVAMLLGTGFRSSAFLIILIVFLTFGVGEKKKIIAKGITVSLILCLMYSAVGILRSGISWNWSSLYKPMLWRFYVNTNNFNSVYTLFPLKQLQYGKTLINDLSVILPGAQDTYMTKLKDILNIQFSGGSLTPSIFGEGYYNWGWAGAILWPLFVLGMVILLDTYNRKHVDAKIYYAISCVLTGPTTSCLMPSILNTILPLLLVYYALMYLSRHYKLKF